MNRSESIKELAAALAKAQGVMGAAKKDSTNPHFRSKYADLSSIIEALQEPLSANGLSYTQSIVTNDKQECGVETLLMHQSGEWIHYDPYFLPVSKADAQGFGSASTYACRYQLRAIFCLPTTDDDGNAAAAAKPMHHPANIEGREIYEGMSTEAKDFIRTHEHAMVKLHAERGDLAGYIAKQEFDDETKLALWNVLPSNVRTAIKKQQADARRPSPAEQA